MRVFYSILLMCFVLISSCKKDDDQNVRTWASGNFHDPGRDIPYANVLAKMEQFKPNSEIDIISTIYFETDENGDFNIAFDGPMDGKYFIRLVDDEPPYNLIGTLVTSETTYRVQLVGGEINNDLQLTPPTGATINHKFRGDQGADSLLFSLEHVHLSEVDEIDRSYYNGTIEEYTSLCYSGMSKRTQKIYSAGVLTTIIDTIELSPGTHTIEEIHF